MLPLVNFSLFPDNMITNFELQETERELNGPASSNGREVPDAVIRNPDKIDQEVKLASSRK